MIDEKSRPVGRLYAFGWCAFEDQGQEVQGAGAE